MNDKTSERGGPWPTSSSKGRSDNAVKKDRGTSAGKRARRASRLPPGRIINFRRTRNPFNILSETL